MLSRSDIDLSRNLDFGEGNGLATGVQMLRNTHLLIRCTFASESREHRFFAANHESNSAPCQSQKTSGDVHSNVPKFEGISNFPVLSLGRMSYGELHFHNPMLEC